MRALIYLFGAVVVSSSAYAGVLPTLNVGTGSLASHVLINFSDGAAYRFNVSYDGAADGIDLFDIIEADTTLTTVRGDFGFGIFIDGISYEGHSDAGYGGGDLWWHYWLRDSEGEAWDSPFFGASDRVHANGTWDGWVYGNGDAPVPEPASVALLGAAGLVWALRRQVIKPIVPVIAVVGMLGAASWAQAATAVSVVGYTPGTINLPTLASYTNPAVALSEALLDTGPAGGSNRWLNHPYSNPWSPTDLVAIGSGGSITLQLSHFAVATDGTAEIGIFTSQMIVYGGGGLLNGDQQAAVWVSTNGNNWVTINGGSTIGLNVPESAYIYPSDPFLTANPGNPANFVAADFETPFPGPLPDVNDAGAFEAGRAAAYGSSAGGNWIDLSGLGLTQAGYVRIEVPVEATVDVRLDAIYLNRDVIGAEVPEPATVGLLGAAGMAWLLRRRR